ncbi:hypothetical protein N9922_03235 [Cyclobacteriaceae bacterium]|jgi:hypothetical protein|nr:hypothetical protein [Cyclobacteriaceae bacterium]OUT95413.1 MAG: hypothetical protein CBB92_11815 [Flammeovirgaceae bacterium TMED32]MDA9905940.1 hypothetical protein [Cyclobacteriaceae bacterium]MDB4291208.1 hypothetical protein [Cyclobacteriaceae bacterium]MDB4316513.1 hypothetical protein [Cyclobacteriaceae bacterium]|tara:strand:- start:899 stop:1108 length:210 start_codon:yes stop_codon:yes gene_type:complete
MPSRQVRITLSDLESHFQEWLTFMRKDGAVIFGKMISIEGNKILYQNSSMKRALIFRSELDEVWRDVQT